MKLNVMVVDDETPICEWLIYCVRRSSEEHEIHSAPNGEEAFALIQEYKPDVVFTDIRMPGMDGLELMRRVLEIYPFTVFAILTNYAEFSYAKQALSLGAREYFLKSELRASDIENFLSLVEKSKETITANKQQDVLPSGCIDLYNFYRDQEQPGYAESFWAKQGMDENVPYMMLCVPGGKSQEDWRRLVRLAQELRERSDEPMYAAVASEKEHEYIVLQTNGALRDQVQKMIGLLGASGGVGVSTAARLRQETHRTLRESACALSALFFDPSGETVYYEKLACRAALDREQLRRQKREILGLLARRQYDETQKDLTAWFADMARPSAEDVTWGIDYSRRLVLAVEERYYHEVDKPPQEMAIQTSLAQCRDRCLDLIRRLKSLHGGRCSPSIETALKYIHQHYQESISMVGVAKLVYRSPEYFSRQFKEEVGENFSVYLTLYRLDRAKELLLQTDLRVNEIAERVGYTTPGYFSRLYKKYKGVTPEQERGSKM